MLDGTSNHSLCITPTSSLNPHCKLQFMAFVVDGSKLTGAGETELDAVFDLVEMLIDARQPSIEVVSAIEGIDNPAWITGLIDWICGIDGGDAYIEAAISHLETLDPQAAAERRKWF